MQKRLWKEAPPQPLPKGTTGSGAGIFKIDALSQCRLRFVGMQNTNEVLVQILPGFSIWTKIPLSPRGEGEMARTYIPARIQQFILRL